MTNTNGGLPASIRARLMNHARKTGQDYNRVVERYALERFLYRLSKSDHAERFVLKGALMMLVWLGEDIRPTRDADLLGFGEMDDERLLAALRDICNTVVDPDGMVYLPDTLAVEDIRENDAYGGRRLTLRSQLGNAELRIQVDVGIGDAVTPEPEQLEYPSLLDAAGTSSRLPPGNGDRRETAHPCDIWHGEQSNEGFLRHSCTGEERSL